MTTTLSRYAAMLLVLVGSSVASAEAPSRTASDRDAARPTHRTAEAARPVEQRKVDPVEAALARAMALSATPVAAAPARPSAAADGLASLHRHTRRAVALGLGERSRSRALPSDETVLHLGVQPLDGKLVTKLVTERLPAVHYCHESLVARRMAEGGQVNLHFVVEPRGFVSEVTVTAGGAHADELKACITREIRRWKFPAADAPTVVDYPIVFDVAGSSLGQ